MDDIKKELQRMREFYGTLLIAPIYLKEEDKTFDIFVDARKLLEIIEKLEKKINET